MEIHENLFQGETQDIDFPKFDTFRPMNDLVLVKRYQEDNSKAGSFIVPEKFRQASNQGIIVAISPLSAGWFNRGDRITFGIGNAENIIIDGVEHLLIRENDIRGVERAL